jgi:hypothetical protein
MIVVVDSVSEMGFEWLRMVKFLIRNLVGGLGGRGIILSRT